MDIVFFLFFVAFLIVFSFGLYYLVRLEKDRGFFSRAFGKEKIDFRALMQSRKMCLGEIISHEVEEISVMTASDSMRSRFILKIEYEYEVAGNRYIGNVTPFSYSHSGVRYMIDDLVAAIGKDKSIAVYIDGADPKKSFGIYQEMCSYPKFDRAEMLKRAKQERKKLWAGKSRRGMEE